MQLYLILKLNNLKSAIFPFSFCYVMHLISNRCMLFLYLFFVFSFSDCSSQESHLEKKRKRTMDSWIGREIQIPDNLESYNFINNKDFKMKLIHITEISCKSCFDEISALKPFINQLNHVNNEILTVIILNNVSSKDIGKLSFSDFSLSVLFDPSNIFITRNRIVNRDIIKTMLINDNKIVDIGDIGSKDFQDRILSYMKSAKDDQVKNKN